jgi:ABC-type polysaccharide/polyol phosphate transport system ATPase subunit
LCHAIPFLDGNDDHFTQTGLGQTCERQTVSEQEAAFSFLLFLFLHASHAPDCRVEIRTPKDVLLVSDLSFKVEVGQSLLLTGHNGAG